MSQHTPKNDDELDPVFCDGCGAEITSGQHYKDGFYCGMGCALEDEAEQNTPWVDNAEADHDHE